MVDRITIEGTAFTIRDSDGKLIYETAATTPPVEPVDPPPTTEGAIKVGPNRTHKTLKAGIDAARDGDTIEVDSGTYSNDFATISKKLTIRGVGATRPKLVATQSPSNGKGILVTQTDLKIENIEFSGCAVTDRNGAGIRYEGGNLMVGNCLFHDNQNGILANAAADGFIEIIGTEFNHNGAGDGYSHNIYVNTVAHLIMDDCYAHNAVVGHQIKSRAKKTTITNCRIYDDNGNGSYSIDLPEGGASKIVDCTIQQSASAGNSTMIAYAMEKQPGSGSSLVLDNNTCINDRTAGVTLVKNNSQLAAVLKGSKVWGINQNQMLSGPGTVMGTVQMASRPPLP